MKLTDEMVENRCIQTKELDKIKIEISKDLTKLSKLYQYSDILQAKIVNFFACCCCKKWV